MNENKTITFSISRIDVVITILLTFILLGLKLDGNTITWVGVFYPIIVWCSLNICACIGLLLSFIIKSIDETFKEKANLYNGPKMVWDAKTQTMYKPNMNEPHKNEESETWTIIYTNLDELVYFTMKFYEYEDAHDYAVNNFPTQEGRIELRHDRSGKIVWSCNVEDWEEAE